MRNDFFAHLQTLPLGYFQANRTGDLMSRATNDLNAVRMMIGPAIMYSANTLLTFVVALSLMISIDPRLTLWSLIPLPFVSISVKLFGTAIHKRFERIQAQLSEVSAVAQEALSGVRVVRAYRQEGAELERFRVSIDEYLRRNKRLIVLQGFFFPSMGFFLGLGALVVVWLGSREVIAGRITRRPVRRLQRVSDDVELADDRVRLGDEHAAARHGVVEADARGARDGAGDCRSPSATSGGRRVAIRGAIEFRDLVFSYGETRRAQSRVGDDRGGADRGAGRRHRIGEVDADLAAGAAARAAAGHGVHRRRRRARHPAGDAAQRDRLRPAGAVPVLGHARGQRRLRARWARTERSAKAAERATRSDRRERIEAAAAVARLDKDVADFPKGYETMVGERGITLSGGQKQRTALARAIVIDPRILILDDALSAVDTYTEEEILSRLRGVMRERTSIIVSHRISTVRDADVILAARPRAASPSAARTTSWSRRTASTRRCTRSSCWKRSSRRRRVRSRCFARWRTRQIEI